MIICRSRRRESIIDLGKVMLVKVMRQCSNCEQKMGGWSTVLEELR